MDVTTNILSTPLEGVTDLYTEPKLSSSLIHSPTDVPLYNALLHIHLERGLMRIDVEPFQTEVVNAIATAKTGRFLNCNKHYTFYSHGSFDNTNYELLHFAADLAVTAVVVKQEEVYTRDNSKFVRVSLHVIVAGTIMDFRNLKDINEIALARRFTEDSQFHNRIKVV